MVKNAIGGKINSSTITAPVAFDTTVYLRVLTASRNSAISLTSFTVGDTSIERDLLIKGTLSAIMYSRAASHTKVMVIMRKT